MKTSLFGKMLNAFWTTLLILILLFAFFRSYLPFKTALLASIAIAIAIEFLMSRLHNFQLKKAGIKSNEIEHAKKVINVLYISTTSVVNQFFWIAINKSTPAKLQNDWIETKSHLFCMCFENKITTKSDILSKLEKAPKCNKEKVAFGIDFEPEIASMKIKTFDKCKTYAFLKQQKTFPKVENVVLKKKNFFKGIINKKLSWKYFSLAIIFSLTSFFVPQTKFYIICSAIVTFFAIICLFTKKQNEDIFALI